MFKNERMRKLLTTLFLSCILSGCIITQHNGLHDIINENHQVYTSYEKVEFNNVAAILKSFSTLVNSKEYNDFKELREDEKNFIEKLSVEPISNNYPIRASQNEIIVIRSFLKDVVRYLRQEDISAHNFQLYINKASTIFVTELIEHEEKIYR
jgi:hypothetical protein